MNAPSHVEGTRTVRIAASGATLAGAVFHPASHPRGAAVVHGATGVPQTYYAAFARWLADTADFIVMTYDYRGFGASGDARRSSATMVDWGVLDQPAAQGTLARIAPGLPVTVIGHSLGGLMVPFHPGAAAIERIVAVASGPVHLSDHPAWFAPVALAFWTGGAAATRLAGHFPGRRLRLGTDLPAGAFTDWRRWCTTRGFYLCDVGGRLPPPDWRAFRGRLKAVAVADDAMVPPRAVWRTLTLYPEAYRSQLTLTPPRGGKIGHIGAFSRRNADLWPSIMA